MSDDFDPELEDEGGGSGGAGWMATFADMMTLLLTFFVLLLSFATMDVVKFRMALGSVKDALGVQVEHPGDIEALSASIVPLSDVESSPNPAVLDQMAILKEVRRVIARQGLQDVVEADLGGRGVIVRVKDRALYELGSAELRPQAQRILDHIVTLCKRLDYPLMVEGHTDDLPIRTVEFPSNWELSAARAISAMRYFVANGVASGRVGVAGYADVRPLVPNDSAENRAKNRRVEFIFINMESDDQTTSPSRSGPVLTVSPVIAPPPAPALETNES